MEKEILLSVIVPVYNVERYLERCVASLLDQPGTNLEVILVDDGSTDGSGATVRSDCCRRQPGKGDT